MKLTKKAIKKYLKSPYSCPYCGEEEIGVGDDIEGGINQAWQTVSCRKCHKSWREIFTMTDVEGIYE